MYKLEQKQVKDRVFMQNELRLAINAAGEHAESVLKPFIDKKAVKATRELTKKIHDQLNFDTNRKVPPLTEGGFATVQYTYINTGYSCLYLNVSLCFNGGSYDDNTHYSYNVKNSYFLGDIKDGVLTSVRNFTLPMIDAETEWNTYSKAYDTIEKGNDIASKLELTETRENLR